MDDLINRHVAILVFLFLLFLLGVKLLPFSHFRQLFEDIRIMLGVVFQSNFHVFHPTIEVADLSNFFSFVLHIL